jgi:hypothetical protein
LIRDKIKEGEGFIKQNWQGTRDEVLHSFEQWDEKSQEMIRGFLSLFGNDGVMKFWKRSSAAPSPIMRPKSAETPASSSKQ